VHPDNTEDSHQIHSGIVKGNPVEMTPAKAGAPEQEPGLFGTETMAELCARQGRLGEAIKIYQRLLSQSPPPDKVARWTDRCKSLERARAHAPDLILPDLPRPTATAAEAPAEARPESPPGSGFDDRDITVVEPEPTAAAAATVEPASPTVAAPAAPAAPAAETPKQPVSADTAAVTPATSRVAATTRVVVEEPHKLPMVVTQPVRSGQVVYARRNDLIVLASVNPGGQVVADGNIHIYGALRGRAIAGVQGATEARIFCQKLEAELLAISGIYLIWDDIPKANLGKPAQVALEGQVCLVSPL
jgi:septum formation inhibitor MinC